MKLDRNIRCVLCAFPTALVLLLAMVSAAAGDTMVLQPDGKIVVAGRTWPESGALARLNPDGSLDTSFGSGGYVTDHRLPGFPAVALRSDGRILGAAVGGFQLARYLPDGSPDPSFATGGIGGTPEPDQAPFIGSGYGPSALLVQPDDEIVIAGIRGVSRGGASDGWVKRYDEGGHLVETIGHVPLPGGGATDSGLTDVARMPDGSFAGVGWFYPGSPSDSEPLLARFVPGAGVGYDMDFGAGDGLVRPTFPFPPGFRTFFRSVTVDGGKLLVAGGAGGTMLLARFHLDGTPDMSFGGNGFVAPPISAPVAPATQGPWEEIGTKARDVAVSADGGIVLGGSTTQWSMWTDTKQGPRCDECPQPMLARFRSDGSLDPSFGSGGLLRLSKPDGGTFVGEVEQVAPLAEGKLLVKGSIYTAGTGPQPWVARLNPDGSYERGFGGEGLAVLHFPCTGQPVAERRAAPCIGSAGVRLRTSGLHRGRPSVSLSVHANVPWAPIRELGLALPRRMRFTKAAGSKLRVIGAGDGTEVHFIAANQTHGPSLILQKIPNRTELRVTLPPGALRLTHRPLARHSKLSFRIDVAFSDLVSASQYGGNQTIVRRAG